MKYAVLFSMLIADKVTVRDRASLQMVRSILKLKKIELVEDPAIFITPAIGLNIEHAFKEEGITLPPEVRVVAFVVKKVKDRSVNQRLTHELRRIIGWLVKNNFAILFVPFCHDLLQETEKDVQFAEEIASTFSYDNIFILKNYYTPSEIAALLKNIDVLIGMRFHAMVFAHVLKIPLVPIPYEEKCLAFLKANNYDYIPLEEVNFESIKAVIEQMPLKD